MKLSRNDRYVLGLAALIVAVFVTTAAGWGVPLIGDSPRWATVVILILGLAAGVLSAPGSESSSWVQAGLVTVAFLFAVLASTGIRGGGGPARRLDPRADRDLHGPASASPGRSARRNLTSTRARASARTRRAPMVECPGGLSPGIRHPQAAVPSRPPRIVQLGHAGRRSRTSQPGALVGQTATVVPAVRRVPRPRRRALRSRRCHRVRRSAPPLRPWEACFRGRAHRFRRACALLGAKAVQAMGRLGPETVVDAVDVGEKQQSLGVDRALPGRPRRDPCRRPPRRRWAGLGVEHDRAFRLRRSRRRGTLDRRGKRTARPRAAREAQGKARPSPPPAVACHLESARLGELLGRRTVVHRARSASMAKRTRDRPPLRRSG